MEAEESLLLNLANEEARGRGRGKGRGLPSLEDASRIEGEKLKENRWQSTESYTFRIHIHIQTQLNQH